MKTSAVVLALAVWLAQPAFCADTKSSTKMPVLEPPVIFNVVGTTAVTLPPSRYPNFLRFTGDNPDCEAYLLQPYADTDGNDTADTGLSGAPIWLKSKFCPAVAGQNPAGINAGEQEILSRVVAVPERFRATADILVTWTIRVEGRAPAEAYKVKEALCSPWNGSSTQGFSGGLVATRVYVNGKPKGQEVSMSIPAIGELVRTVNETQQPTQTVNDPTITGSYLIKAEDFGDGRIPASVAISVRWRNDTCLVVTSPAKMHNAIITLMPLGKE